QRDFDEVRTRLLEAAKAGEPRAAVQLAILIPDRPEHAVVRIARMRAVAAAGEPIARAFLERSPPSPPSAPLVREDVRSRVAWPHERPLPEAVTRSERPRLAALPGLCTADESIYVALKGLPMLRPAR